MYSTSWKQRYGDSSLKLMITATYTKNFEQITRELVINNLMHLRFKLNANISEGNSTISCSFSISKHAYCKTYCTLKMNIASSAFEYSERGIHIPENWSDWQLMNSVPVDARGSPVYTKLWDVSITVHEVKTDTISSQLYVDGDFTDFYLTAADGSIAVHKAFLAAHSDVFKAMLTGEWKETAEGQIKIEGITVKTLELLKDYMYLGSVPDEGLRPLLLIARCYMIKDLERHCIRKLAETVSPNELFSLIEFACENNIPELPYAILQLTRDSVVDIAHRIRSKRISSQKQKEVKQEEEKQDEEVNMSSQ